MKCFIPYVTCPPPLSSSSFVVSVVVFVGTAPHICVLGTLDGRLCIQKSNAIILVFDGDETLSLIFIYLIL